MNAHEARQIAGQKYDREVNDALNAIEDAATNGHFSVMFKEPLSDFVKIYLTDRDFAIGKSSGWLDIVSW